MEYVLTYKSSTYYNGFHMESMWNPCGFHMDSMSIPCVLIPHGFHMDSMWNIPNIEMELRLKSIEINEEMIYINCID